MNINVKYATLATVEINEVFVINLHDRIYMGWKQDEITYRSIDSLGTVGHFNLNTIEAERDVFVIGNTTSLIDVQHYAPWFVGERDNANTRVGGTAALDALQGISALRLAVKAAQVTRTAIR